MAAMNYMPGYKSFKEWTLARKYDMSRFVFTGRLTPELGRLLATTDLHIYPTVPFVLLSMMMAFVGATCCRAQID
jgi:hypothetical protein